MNKLTGILALLFAALLIVGLVCFENLDWSLKSISLSIFALFLGFVHCLSLTISQKGLLQKVLFGAFALQLIFVGLLLSNSMELKTLWYWQFSLALLSICIGLISSSLRIKVSPLVYYLQYLILGIIAFCLLGLGLTPISVGTITIGFCLLSLLSAIIHLFVKPKAHSI